jgi:hypothetical protein
LLDNYVSPEKQQPIKFSSSPWQFRRLSTTTIFC